MRLLPCQSIDQQMYDSILHHPGHGQDDLGAYNDTENLRHPLWEEPMMEHLSIYVRFLSLFHTPLAPVCLMDHHHANHPPRNMTFHALRTRAVPMVIPLHLSMLIPHLFSMVISHQFSMVISHHQHLSMSFLHLPLASGPIESCPPIASRCTRSSGSPCALAALFRVAGEEEEQEEEQ